MGPICFDLDGTLMDPLPGIMASLARSCPALGLAIPTETQVRPHIGPGIRSFFEQYLSDPQQVEGALARYWEDFEDVGLAGHRLYEGVSLMIPRLRHHGHRLHVVTTKPTTFAKRLLHQFDLLLDFDEVLGTDLKGIPSSKSDRMAALCRDGESCQDGFFVGDRGTDMKTGLGFGLRALGVSFGYGSREELLEAGAERVFDSITELDEWLEAECPGQEDHDLISRAE